MDEAKEALRALIEKVELVPVSAEDNETGKPGLAIPLHEALANLLRLACGLPAHEVVGAVPQIQKTRTFGAGVMLILVAGARTANCFAMSKAIIPPCPKIAA